MNSNQELFDAVELFKKLLEELRPALNDDKNTNMQLTYVNSGEAPIAFQAFIGQLEADHIKLTKAQLEQVQAIAQGLGEEDFLAGKKLLSDL